jgi:hypothetical protein
MSTKDFARKLAEDDGFAHSVAASPKIWLIGDEDDFTKLVANRQA